MKFDKQERECTCPRPVDTVLKVKGVNAPPGKMVEAQWEAGQEKAHEDLAVGGR